LIHRPPTTDFGRYELKKQMRILVIGAGASIAEGLEAGNKFEDCLPAMNNFARKMWSNYNPHPLLDHFLRSIGYEPPKGDARPLFYELEENGITNVEKFFEYAWLNKDKAWLLSEYEAVKEPGKAATLKSDKEDKGEESITEIGKQPLPKDFIRGFRTRYAGDNKISIEPAGQLTYWENMLYHGIGHPMGLLLMQNFFENGVGFKTLKVSQAVANKLSSSDIALNLNYDTVFEIALGQNGIQFQYSPNLRDSHSIYVCKPHGSLNLVVMEDGRGFAFGQPTWLGTPEPPGGFSFQGIIPPRFAKRYDQNPISKMILDTLRHKKPRYITMWGIGLTESDVDLLSLYTAWARRGSVIEIINPDNNVAKRVMELIPCKVHYYENHLEWIK